MKVALRKAEQDYFNQEIASNKNNSGAIWKIIRSALPKKSRGLHYTKNTDTLANEFKRFQFYFCGGKSS